MGDIESFLNKFGKEKFEKKEQTKIERENEILEFIDLLKKLWLKYPEQRFSQLLYNYTKMGTPKSEKLGPSEGLKDFFSYLDKDLIENIKSNLKT